MHFRDLTMVRPRNFHGMVCAPLDVVLHPLLLPRLLVALCGTAQCSMPWHILTCITTYKDTEI